MKKNSKTRTAKNANSMSTRLNLIKASPNPIRSASTTIANLLVLSKPLPPMLIRDFREQMKEIQDMVKRKD